MNHLGDGTGSRGDACLIYEVTCVAIQCLLLSLYCTHRNLARLLPTVANLLLALLASPPLDLMTYVCQTKLQKDLADTYPPRLKRV